MSPKDPQDDDLIGHTIEGRYRIISRLGAGGMGTAYRAGDEQRGVPVVIKIPKKIFLEDPNFAERFHREIRLLQGLTHPHIVPIIDVGTHEGLPFVAMRFLPGGSLSNRRLRDDRNKPRPNPPGMLHLWLPAVAEALDYVHSQGVVHRDVKPANIFFDAFWGAYLGDFGIAKVVDESETFDKEHTLTATHMGIGTQEYMCPEQFTPKAVIDGRADQYALAVMVYEMVAGTRPFTGATAHLIVEVTTQQPPPLQVHRRDLPSSLVEAVHRGLAKISKERFATCTKFAEAVLCDVQRLESDLGVARLLCPNPGCSNLLKLPTTAAGRRGKCPKCQKELKVADDLGALWLLDEVRRQRDAALVPADSDSIEEHAQRDETSVGNDSKKRVESLKRAFGKNARDADETGGGPKRVLIGGLCLFFFVSAAAPFACGLIEWQLLSLVHRDQVFPSPVVYLGWLFCWCCAAAAASLYALPLPDSSLPLRILKRIPRLLFVGLCGVAALFACLGVSFLGAIAIDVFFGWESERFENFVLIILACWSGLVGVSALWLWPNGWLAIHLLRWLGNPSLAYRVLFAAIAVIAVLQITFNIASSRPKMRLAPPTAYIMGENDGKTIQEKRRRTSAVVTFWKGSPTQENPQDASDDYYDEWYRAGRRSRILRDTAPARYCYYSKPATWSEACAFCKRMGGHLLVIETPEELAFIRDAFGPIPGDEQTAVWTGGYRAGYARRWKWIDALNQVLWWAEHKPVTVGTPQNTKDGDRLSMLLDSSGALVARRAQAKLPFICEW